MARTNAALVAIFLASVGLNADDKPAKVERKTDYASHETVWVTGTVLAVTKDTILMTREKKEPVTLPMHDCLAAGKVHKLVTEANSYLLTDVKVGDIVTLDIIQENKQTYCVAINIWERPGGLVPAGQVVQKKQPYHELRNAQIALRDKGTPIPTHLKPRIPVLIDDSPKK